MQKIIFGPSRRSSEINCYKYSNLSKNTIIKFSIEKIKFFSEDYYEFVEKGIPKEVIGELKRLYEGKEADIDLLKTQLTDILNKINSKYQQIIPVFEECMFRSKESTKVVDAPFLLSLNVLLRSSKYAFIPYREISYVPELIRRTIYSTDIRFIEK